MTIDLRYGDTIEQMKLIPDKSIDMIFCDLPYGTTACKWDVIIPFDKLWEQYERIIKSNGAIVLFASQPFTSILIQSNIKLFKYSLVWKKNKPSNIMQAKTAFLKDHEDICIFSKANISATSKNKMNYFPQGLIDCNNEVKSIMNNSGIHGNRKTKKYTQTKTNYPRSILEFKKDSKNIHPTQKPVKLLEYLINSFTKENDFVLDNCAGSGSTGVACLNINRNFIGIENNMDYFNISLKRVEEKRKEKDFNVVTSFGDGM